MTVEQVVEGTHVTPSQFDTGGQVVDVVHVVIGVHVVT
jgi:hypothetical protein